MRPFLLFTLFCPLLVACTPRAGLPQKSSPSLAIVTATVQQRIYAAPIEAIGTGARP